MNFDSDPDSYKLIMLTKKQLTSFLQYLNRIALRRKNIIKQESVPFLKKLIPYFMLKYKDHLTALKKNKKRLTFKQKSILQKLEELYIQPLKSYNNLCSSAKKNYRKYSIQDINTCLEAFTQEGHCFFKASFLKFLRSEELRQHMNQKFGKDQKILSNYKEGARLIQDELNSAQPFRLFYSQSKNLSKYNFDFSNTVDCQEPVYYVETPFRFSEFEQYLHQQESFQIEPSTNEHL